MSENVENLVLEHLERFQVNDAEISAHLQAQLDGVRDRLDRIERRLEL